MTLDYLEDAVQAFGQLLVSRGLRVCCAESCTGGLLAGALTSVAGSSDWFDQGFVTYTNQAKIDVLNVSPDTLAHHGAVSEETAMEMAAGALAASPDADVALSTTGIAGPGGATPGKPVGMVCLGAARRTPEGVVARAVTKQFQGERTQVRLDTVDFALGGMLAHLGLADVAAQ